MCLSLIRDRSWRSWQFALVDSGLSVLELLLRLEVLGQNGVGFVLSYLKGALNWWL